MKRGKKSRFQTWAPYRVQCPCLQCQNQPRWILPNFPSVDMGTLSKTVRFSLYPCHWVFIHTSIGQYCEVIFLWSTPIYLWDDKVVLEVCTIPNLRSLLESLIEEDGAKTRKWRPHHQKALVTIYNAQSKIWFFRHVSPSRRDLIFIIFIISIGLANWRGQGENQGSEGPTS